MKPRLVRLSGSASEEITLSSDDVTIGRDASSIIHVQDPTVSSHHCLIERDKETFLLIDRDSTNGTFINGKAVKQAPLKHGDEILVGSTKFYFLIDDVFPLLGEICIEEPSEELVLSSDTTQLNPADLTDHRIQQHLSVLLKLSTEINHIDSSTDLQEVLLERIFQLVPVEEGVILLGSELNQL